MSSAYQPQRPIADPRSLLPTAQGVAGERELLPAPPNLFGRRISTSRLIQLCRRLGTSIRAGVEARKLWETEARYGSATHRKFIARVKEGVLAGASVADSLRACGGYFPPLMCEMVEVGEKTGHLDSVLLKLADNFEHQATMTRNFLFGIAWPLFQLCFAVFIIGGLMGLTAWISAGRGGEPIDMLGIGISGTSGMWLIWGTFAVLAATAGTLIYATARGWLGPTPVMLAMRIPVLGGAFESLALARMTWALSMGLDAGIDAQRSVQLAFRAAHNPYYQSRGRAVDQEIRRNQQFHEAFAAAAVFPDDFLQRLESAEIAGATSESLQAMARDYEDRAKRAISIITWVLGTVIWLAVLFMVAGVIIVMGYNIMVKPIDDLLNLKPGTI